MVEEQEGTERSIWQKNSQVWRGVDGRRIARLYGQGQMVEEQLGMERGRWQKNRKVQKGVDGRRIARYGEGQMVENCKVWRRDGLGIERLKGAGNEEGKSGEKPRNPCSRTIQFIRIFEPRTIYSQFPNICYIQSVKVLNICF